ncbi:MAG: glyoxalase [Acidimicrobiales bacterium]|nr:glyoxalase [Acidimicrobiales bacterium]
MSPQLNALGIVTSDLFGSVRFYRHLGVEVGDPAEGESHVEATLPGGLRIMWDTVEVAQSIHPEARPGGGGGATFAFACDGAADVDATYARLIDEGYSGRNEPWDAPWGQRYAVVEDPDGNPVDLFAPLDPR